MGEVDCSPWRSRRRGRTRCCFGHPETGEECYFVVKLLRYKKPNIWQNRKRKQICFVAVDKNPSAPYLLLQLMFLCVRVSKGSRGTVIN